MCSKKICFESKLNVYCLFLLLLNLHAVLSTVSNLPLQSKIIGGSPIAIAQAPWQVSLRLKANEHFELGHGFICGGSVISQRVVLTAAHCLTNSHVKPWIYRQPAEFLLLMGTVNLYRPTPPFLYYSVQQLLPHQNFSLTTLANDIGLMFINGYIPWHQHTVRAIALNQQTVLAGSICTISGWGYTSNNEAKNRKPSPVLMSTNVPIVPDNLCIISYTNLYSGIICAGNLLQGGVDSCQGDSGGPLVFQNHLVGIVSWGLGCAAPYYPGIYTNVSYFHNWIVQQNATLNYTYYAPSSGHVNYLGRRVCLFMLAVLGILNIFVNKIYFRTIIINYT